MSDDYKQAVRDLFIRSRGGTGDNFTILLLHLIGKADPDNRYRISQGFPQTVKAWFDWHSSPNEKEFFEKNGFGIQEKGLDLPKE